MLILSKSTIPRPRRKLTQDFLQLHDTRVGADVLNGLGLPALVGALIEHRVLGAIGIPSRHSEADSICLASMALF